MQRETLKQRHKAQLRERRAQRRNEFNNSNESVRATTLEELESVTSRAGFLRQQLKVMELTPLRRWHLQLKLLVAEDEVANADVESVLTRHKRCFDVMYREGLRVADARDSLLEEAPTAVKQVLSFSTTVHGCICRVTCVNDGNCVTFTSSLYVENLQPTLLNLLDTNQSVISALTFLEQQ
ncbi:uncharacterized protein KRP23_1504 [Phytophthora ramorum]|uniref:uncharacterized protein n=1 Tax=Phytophthora ramorum TaxID=164328 RepID=UPI0030ACF82A|nr:hypothetical protein KRP23_1504 [Phytophthora ramorum]